MLPLEAMLPALEINPSTSAFLVQGPSYQVIITSEDLGSKLWNSGAAYLLTKCLTVIIVIFKHMLYYGSLLVVFSLSLEIAMRKSMTSVLVDKT
jgi:hypothetical protein